MIVSILASIPSPPSSGFQVGPVRITYYGILIALGVIVAWQLTRSRFQARGGDPERLERLLGRVVLFGFLGARLAYVSTHLSRYEGEWWKVIAIWEGGLALYGGITVGAITIFVYARRWRLELPDVLDSLAPSVPIAQAIGRWGNYFNQELFGTPTQLPWGLEIDPANRPAAYPDAATFHPTFLYESLWNLALAAFILWLDRRSLVPRGRLVAVYLVGYGLIRFLLELIRTDTTFRVLGISRNGWVSLLVIGIATVVLIRTRTRPQTDAPPGP